MEKTLDFKVIFYLLRKKIIWLILAAVIGGLGTFMYTDNVVPKRYRATAQVYISNTQDLGEISSTNISASRYFASTYRIILTSDKAYTLLREMLNDNPEYHKCSYKTSYNTNITVKDETEILQISVTSRDPKLSVLVCNTMMDVSKVLIADIFDDAGKAHSLGDAKGSSKHISPNVETSTFIGASVALMAVAVLIVFMALLDNRVKDEADFVAKVNIPVLGEVPSINEHEEEKEGYYYYAYTKKEEKS